MVYRKFIIHQPIFGMNLGYLSTYYAPHVWMMAIVVLMFFVQKCQLPHWLERVCCFCAPSMFSIYLLHLNCGEGVSNLVFRMPVDYLYNYLHYPPFVSVTMAAIFCYCCCLLFDMMRRLLLWPFQTIVDYYLTRIDNRFEGIVL